ncbi:hypothetical protein V1264_016495 [Littorina saxatilis]|uniref:Uncharacterized protein n=1 Tax=Littorina saxatilis TaxID=31220 RepID=A0AAN9BPF1_9CAEN
MNVRDLPRSTTPVNDHDPDKLNMKQVIAFLQSKGKSQEDAVELPQETKSKVAINNHDLHLPRTVKSGVLRGTVRKSTASSSSTATEIYLRSSAILSGEGGGRGGRGGGGEWRDGSPSASSTQRVDGGGGGGGEERRWCGLQSRVLETDTLLGRGDCRAERTAMTERTPTVKRLQESRPRNPSVCIDF